MFEEFLGQDKAIDPLVNEIMATRFANLPLPHMLLLGPPGSGKTTLAKLVARGLTIPFEIVHAPTVDDRESLTQAVKRAQGGILFIEEAHALKRRFAEDIFTVIDSNEIVEDVPVMETQQVPGVVTFEDGTQDLEMVDAEVPSGRTERARTALRPLTVIGATTDEALLPAAFLSRLSGLVIRLQEYDSHALINMAVKHAETKNLHLQRTAAAYIAERCRGNPRRLIQLTDRSIARAWAEGMKAVNARHAYIALAALGIDDYGLEEPHRKMLRVLTTPVSRTMLAQRTGLPVRNVDLYFGELVRLGMATIENKHTITDKGREVIEYSD